MNFLKYILLENYEEFANRFLNKGAEVETRLAFKVWEIQFMWLKVYFFWDFCLCPGEHYRFWPVLGARHWVNLHLFIDIIHDFCNYMIPLVHLFKAS